MKIIQKIKNLFTPANTLITAVYIIATLVLADLIIDVIHLASK